MRRAKIVATLGPATSSYDDIRAIIDAGVDVARMNLSHGSYDVHEGVYANVRQASADSGRAVAVLVDLQGPKIRLGKFADGPHDLEVGDVFKITTDDILGSKEICGTTFKGLPDDVTAGDPLLIDDGRVKLRVLETDGTVVTTEVVVAGTVSNNKGINLPGVAVNVPALSDKDEADLRWGLRLGADLIALSFVRDADDVVRVHEIMAEEGRKVPVYAKIEKPQAVDNLEAIIDAFDGIMVARGDLGVELPLEAVPIVQKHAVELSRRMAKPVIVATQMLESMISSPIPTRAETSDVANAVLDGTDAVMLSGETSVGEYPVITVQTMARIVASTEEHGLERIPPLGTRPRTQGGAITLAAADVADFVQAKFLCVFTESGDSVRRMSRLRHSIPILAFTPNEAIRRRMAISWGVQSYLVETVTHTDAMFAQVDDILLGNDLAESGDKVIVIAGSPPGIAGSTNDLRVHRVGDAHGEAAPAYASQP
ncbi:MULTISPECIES: pyruvate kinase [Frigoribacterium]|jgi:pyruvate kinase|uniref:pyruvate kinase n=1 Tax=Frigoribacterium TaxID=96492 RepID=UPI0006F9AABC|nr:MULTISPECIES: pyruvate kinase [Frigoribacterium]KQM25144.1 pyruvate kinase [Frigoribacterium sp. Leaf8]MBD8138989.1 pyruvate kinase [Frigoribacterium sp. CFBP 13605]MBD8485633.1 pyruvate kinase [Frigoribacterium sp. CFBP 8759]NQW85966.1 pyruvate kinase [Frigoribacterium sp. VKM Ac-2860]NQX07298.1 pyruvate kinase [Frigoribacterium sp. VKM Ac-2859]